MTWKTPRGDRVLSGAEAKLFTSCIATMLDFARDSAECGFKTFNTLTVGPFERLSDSQKFTVLHEVAVALLTPTQTVPKQTAVNENAIWYVYCWLMEQFDDVDCGEEVWGQDILDAINETNKADQGDKEEEDDDDFWPTLGCLDEDKWRSAIDCLADRILWDRDWEMEHLLPHGRANPGMMNFMRIDHDYFKPYNKRGANNAQKKLYDFVLTFMNEGCNPGM